MKKSSVFLVLVMAGAANAAILHDGDNDPASEDIVTWNAMWGGDVSLGPNEDNSAWEVVTESQFGYRYQLTGADVPTNNDPWSAQWTMTVVEPGDGSLDQGFLSLGFWTNEDNWELQMRDDLTGFDYLDSVDVFQTVTWNGFDATGTHTYRLYNNTGAAGAYLEVVGEESAVLLPEGRTGGGSKLGTITIANFGGNTSTTDNEWEWGQMQYDIGEPGPDPTTFTWDVNDLGRWTEPSNWLPSGPPNNPNHKVFFQNTANITGPTTVVASSDVTVNSVSFDSSHSFLVAGFGGVNLTSNTAPSPVRPSINVAASNIHQFQAIVAFQADGTIDIGSDSTLVMNNALNLNGNTITKTGAGNLAVNNILNAGGGTLSIQQGTISGKGEVGGDVTNDGGTISPGNSAGVLSVEGFIRTNFAPTGYGDAASQIPEPSTVILLGIGGLVISYLWASRRRR